MEWKRRAEEANASAGGASFTLVYGGFHVCHSDVRALLILARALQAEDSAWTLFWPWGEFMSSWVPGMNKPDIPDF